MFDKNLISKPSILVINKMDSPNAEENFEEFMKLYADYESKEC